MTGLAPTCLHSDSRKTHRHTHTHTYIQYTISGLYIVLPKLHNCSQYGPNTYYSSFGIQARNLDRVQSSHLDRPAIALSRPRPTTSEEGRRSGVASKHPLHPPNRSHSKQAAIGLDIRPHVSDGLVSLPLRRGGRKNSVVTFALKNGRASKVSTTTLRVD